MLTGKKLWYSDNNDDFGNIDDRQLLCEWSDKTKAFRLSIVKNRAAHNLLSRLLHRDPDKRPTMNHVLLHPFLTGKAFIRLPEEPPLYDVFISYRQASESEYFHTLAIRLKSNASTSIRVWYDKALQTGDEWMKGFCAGLASSRIFVPVISRNAINAVDVQGHPIVGRNWSTLTNTSYLDSVLLEWRLALEFRAQGLIEKIYPVFIGDSSLSNNTIKLYDELLIYKLSETFPNSIVQSIETELIQQLDNLGLGTPYTVAGEVILGSTNDPDTSDKASDSIGTTGSNAGNSTPTSITNSPRISEPASSLSFGSVSSPSASSTISAYSVKDIYKQVTSYQGCKTKGSFNDIVTMACTAIEECVKGLPKIQ